MRILPYYFSYPFAIQATEVSFRSPGALFLFSLPEVLSRGHSARALGNEDEMVLAGAAIVLALSLRMAQS